MLRYGVPDPATSERCPAVSDLTPRSACGQPAFAEPGAAGDNDSMDSGLVARSEDVAGPAAGRPGSQRDLVVLGSTGSIGTQAADIVRRNPGRFRLVALAAGGGNPGLLASQAIEFGVEVVAVASERAVTVVHDALQAKARGAGKPVPKVLAGPAAVAEVAAWQADVVLNAVTGAVGLAATLAALDSGRVLALANKESLIMGGHLVTDRAAPWQIVPVDSEHSAIAQCLRSGRADEVRKLVITASGGPFLRWTREQMETATPEQALAHPTWNMGPVITINSATLVNKGLEVIEAHLLFDIGLDDIDVVVHRQSVIHSMVEFVDGSTIAQASPPDMRIPIALALAWPERVADAASPVDWTAAHTWTFEPLDDAAFPAVALARAAARGAGTTPAVYNAANEECVAAFTAGRIPFGGIVDTIARVVSDHGSSGPRIAGLDDVLAADNWARLRARELTQAGAR
jgi:1-deoxy-D-xylulose-5-phosphate reductoisomerase